MHFRYNATVLYEISDIFKLIAGFKKYIPGILIKLFLHIKHHFIGWEDRTMLV